MSDMVIYHHYCPPGVQRVITSGSSAYIGEVDESTIFKYLLVLGGDMSRLEVERKLPEIIGSYPRIIGLTNFLDTGIYLEHALNGTLAYYLLKSGQPPPSIQQRFFWCRGAAEAVAHVHSKRILHCDIQPTNLLLDEELYHKLSDFQGKLLSKDGEVFLDDWSGEPCRFYCPRDDPFDADIKTDLFALGCAKCFIMLSHAVFLEVIDGEDG